MADSSSSLATLLTPYLWIYAKKSYLTGLTGFEYVQEAFLDEYLVTC